MKLVWKTGVESVDQRKRSKEEEANRCKVIMIILNEKKMLKNSSSYTNLSNFNKGQ